MIDKLPWMFSAATAMWFGVMAARAGRSWWLWGTVGAVFALVTSTIYLGLRQSAFIPISYQAEVNFHIKSVVGAAAVIGFFGWLFTLSLQRWFGALWKQGGKRDA
jgi:hypothetical protein